MLTARFLLTIASFLYLAGFAAVLIAGRRRWIPRLFLGPALTANLASAVLRYWRAWPMLPMYAGTAILPLCLGILIGLSERGGGAGAGTRRLLWGTAALAALAAVCFPKDFYLPFPQSKTLFAHLFFLFGVIGKSCFFVSAARAAAGETDADSFRWAVRGFAFWTISMFCGGLWSYLGWGTPVVWEDPAIVVAMAVWFFYVCFLHLHLTGGWTPRRRRVFAAAGGWAVLALHAIPDLGPFRNPFRP